MKPSAYEEECLYVYNVYTEILLQAGNWSKYN